MDRARATCRGVVATGALLVALSGCGGSSATPAASEQREQREQVTELRASATIEPRSGSAVTGTATFVQVGDGPVQVHIAVQGASPGLHGVHVHEQGDCSDPAAASAGGHFDPHGAPHAGPDVASRHAGDLGNVEVREGGSGDLVITTDLLTVAAGPASVVGRAVVVHAGEDDLTSQPAGNAGERHGCGVVAAER